MKTYTIEEFRKDYPNDAVCLDKLFVQRYGKLEACPHCGVVGAQYRRITTRRAYQCRECYGQLYPTAGTIFEKTTTPLVYWFYSLYLMTVTRNGVSAKELERVLGVTYKTAWRMAKLIREQMGKAQATKKLKGTVECDETYIGGKDTNNTGRNNTVKAPVFAMVERCGEVRAVHTKDSKKNTLFPIIMANVDKSAKVMTDEYKTYTKLGEELGYDHNTIMHALKQYVNGSVSTNTVEGFFSQLKRMIFGSYIHVSKKYLQLYIGECTFRYNNRFNQAGMFGKIISSVDEPLC